MKLTSGKYIAKMVVHGVRASAIRIERCMSQPTLSVFTYHSFCIGKTPLGFPSLSVAMFDRQIEFLKKSYRLVSLSEGLRSLEVGNSHQPMAAITLDDGFSDNYHVAWPVLVRHGVPATVFVATDFIDQRRVPWPTRLQDIVNAISWRKNRDAKFADDATYRQYQVELRSLPAEARFDALERIAVEHKVTSLPDRPSMTWNQMREMHKGGVEFGSHTVFHGLLPFLTDNEVKFELEESKRRIEQELQCECRYFAYPNGDHSERDHAFMRDLGYGAALTQDFGANPSGSDPCSMLRIEVPFHDPLASFRYRARKALRGSVGQRL
jgi:peptidoglycan/xylan/chitin deacetylase (PgdA/CDA1 family)